MGFKVYGSQESAGKKKDIDYDALNKYVVETAQLTQREVLIGYVSVICDLGTQVQEDAEVPFVGNDEDEAAAIAEHPDTYFIDGINPETNKPSRMKCWPQKPIQCVAVAVDFPDIILDKGAFFGESNPLPLRMWLGGQFYMQNTGMVIGRPTALKINKNTGKWSFDAKHLFHKMAVSCKIITPTEAFMPERIDELLGQAFQFEAQVFMKENKGKQYYTEYVKYVSGLGRGQVEPELLTTPTLVQFDVTNPTGAIKELRNHVINTIKQAINYKGSAIQSEIEAVHGTPEADSAPEEAKAVDSPSKDVKASPAAPKAATAAKTRTKAPVAKQMAYEDDDLDIPF